jgi:hypothetical protein
MTTSHVFSFFSALIVGIVTAILSVRLALRRFRAERWWERKAEAYSTLLVALFDIRRYLEFEIRAIEERFEPAEEFLSELRDRSRKGHFEIRKAAAVGTFLYSAPVAERLEALIRDFERPRHNHDFYEEYCEDLDSVRAALAEIKKMGKADLHLA